MDTHEISVKGNKVNVPFLPLNGLVVVIKGRLIKTGEIFDEFWLEKSHLPNYAAALEEISQSPIKPDIFTFIQRVPDTKQQYGYHAEWTNYATILLDTYDHWFNAQISSAAKRNIKASAKRGLEIRICEFDDDFVKGIMSIYNETAIRQGRKFWHYGKSFDAVKAENGTYEDRSAYLGAFYQGEMIGYLKLVWDGTSAAIMQVISKISFYDKRPNNALLAEAVRLCCSKNIKYLIYESLVYGKNMGSSLTEYKVSQGFTRMDVPQYFVPLTLKGSVALRLGLHKSVKERMPFWLISGLLNIRGKFLAITQAV